MTMSIFYKKTAQESEISITSPEALVAAVKRIGIIPFFENPIEGYSIEEMTPAENWFDNENLGPWDWKIFAVQTGEIAYGKFLWNGKAAFARADVYRHLLNYRRSLAKYSLQEKDRIAYEAICRDGSHTSRELRKLCGLKKAQMDSITTRLQQQTRIVIGDFERVYRGEFLTYSGWQLASFCRPEDLFDFDLEANFPTTEESLDYLKELVRGICPDAREADIIKMLS